MRAEAAEHADVLARACFALTKEDTASARKLIQTEYPFLAQANAGRSYNELQLMRLFLRDRFTDRYTGQRLVFPATLRLISRILPVDFPFHRNWKMDETHVAFWELFPTLDHVIPVARGGRDDESNWATTSMLKNSVKSNWTLEELGWSQTLCDLDPNWDGLVAFCREYLVAHPEHLADKYIERWHRAAVKAVET